MDQSSAQRKLLRGIEHLNTLRGEAVAFEDDEPYLFDSETQERATGVIEHRCFAVERQAPPLHWPLLAGEAIQNLRSALEHVLYAIQPSNTVQFPIFTDATRYLDHGAWRIKGLPEPVRARVEGAQPYVVMPTNPAAHPLALLADLSNLDKHRVLATFAAAVDLEYVGVPTGVGIRWLENGTDRPLGHGQTYVSTLVAYAETKGVEVDVKPSFSYEVRVEGRPLGRLVGVAREVFKLVAEIETGETLSPGATYPI